MNLLSNMSIRTKLVLMTAGGIVFALFLAGGAFIANGIYSYREDCVSDLTLVADMVGHTTEAALEFDDSKTATEMLAAVRSFPSVEYVELRDARGQVFATYEHAGASSPTHASFPPAGIHFSNGFLDVVQDIRSDNALIGSLWIRSNLDGLTSRILYHTLIALSALTLALVAGVWLVQRMQSYFTQPIWIWRA